jgi:hypothetical protein
MNAAKPVLDPLPERLAREAVRLRNQADALPPGLNWDALIVRAKPIEDAALMYRAMRRPN